MSSRNKEEELSTNTINTSSDSEEDSEDLFDAKISPRSHRPRRRPSFQVSKIRIGVMKIMPYQLYTFLITTHFRNLRIKFSG